MIRLGFYGFGSIARIVAKLALRRGFEIVGAIDVDPNLVGRDVGELVVGEKLGVVVTKDPSDLADADVVIHATTSYLDRAFPQIATVVDMGINVLSTCETLAYPFYRYPVLARRIDELARTRGVSVVGTGINPGFLLDTLVVVLCSSVDEVRKVVAARYVDAARRRESFRKKIGLGMPVSEVEERLRKGELTGHVGYAESALLIADALRISPTKVVEEQHAVAAETEVESHGTRIGKGMCRGVSGYASLFVEDEEVVRVEFHALAGVEEREEIVIEARESGKIVWRSTGTHGDVGTASVLLSLVEKILEARPGLLTMVDLLPFKPFSSYTVKHAP